MVKNKAMDMRKKKRQGRGVGVEGTYVNNGR